MFRSFGFLGSGGDGGGRTTSYQLNRMIYWTIVQLNGLPLKEVEDPIPNPFTQHPAGDRQMKANREWRVGRRANEYDTRNYC